MKNSLLSLAAIVMLSAVSAHAQKEVSKTDHRPVAAAVDQLELDFGSAINYEDAPYENDSDLEDVSTPQQRASSKGYRLLVPRKGTVKAQVPEIRSEGDKLFSVNSLLHSHSTNKGAGEFRVEQANNMLYVTPTSVTSKNGQSVTVTSPMLAMVTVPYGERKVIDTVALIVDALSKKALTRIDVGSIPVHPTQTVQFGGVTASGRDLLATLLAKVAPQGASYRLLFDPMQRAYMLNIQARAASAPPAASLPTNSLYPDARLLPSGENRFGDRK